MTRGKEEVALGLQNEVPSNEHYKSKHSILDSINLRFWVAAYSLERARQRYADKRQLWREAVACVALSVILIAGGCHA